MRLTSLCLLLVFGVYVVRTLYIPHPRVPNLMIPVIIDRRRPNISLEHVTVEEPRSIEQPIALMYLMVSFPLLYHAMKKTKSAMFEDSAGGGGGDFSVVTGSPCCG